MQQKKIAIIGLGYVGLPLAIEFAKHFMVIGYDSDLARVNQILNGRDRTNEADLGMLRHLLNKSLIISNEIASIREASIFIVTVPTPIDRFNRPDLSFLIMASQLVASALKVGDIVIYESTVYPGCTEEDCVPILESYSGLRYNRDFYVGYSPERINPGDNNHTLTNTVKVTSGSTYSVAIEVDELYGRIISAGTYLAPSIKIAEASKAIENAQRDINISFINELSLIFDKMEIDTTEVLTAASTKYNFLNFKPGLVGGHCISVDPYYLAHKALQLGYHPKVILSGRAVNDMMPIFIARKLVKLISNANASIKGASVVIFGFTFKENCPDIRNTKVVEIYKELNDFGLNVDIFDPWVDKEKALANYGIRLLNEVVVPKYVAVILAVAHDVFRSFRFDEFKANGAIIFDAKAFLDRELVDARL